MNTPETEFTRLIQEHKGTIFTVCYMFSKDEDEVNDLFQETLINLWKGFKSFRNDSKVDTWIYRVSLNTCISQERKKKRNVNTLPLQMDVNLYEDTDSNAHQIRQLHERIQRLGMVDRAIVLMWLEGMPYDEIGAVIGISAQNVGIKLYRIKEVLKNG